MVALTVLPDDFQDVALRPAVLPEATPIPPVSQVLLLSAPSREIDGFTPPSGQNLWIRLRAAMATVEPVLVLLIVAAFLLTELWDRASAHASETASVQISETKGIPQVSEPVSEASPPLLVRTSTIEPVETVKSEGIKAVQRDRPQQAVHMQVTDPATSSALHDLSRYEMKTLRRQAQRGDAAAAFTLGMAYEAGRFVPQSCAKATAWVTTSAKAGDTAARYNLGLRYWYGDGVAANRRQAKKWLRLAAARGYPKVATAIPGD
jgi:hypothetical protein